LEKVAEHVDFEQFRQILENALVEKCGEGVVLKINKKGYRNKPLTERQKVEQGKVKGEGES